MADAVAVSLSESAQMCKFLSRFVVSIDRTFGSFAPDSYQGFLQLDPAEKVCPPHPLNFVAPTSESWLNSYCTCIFVVQSAGFYATWRS